MSQLLQFARVEANKRANNKVGTVLLDTLYYPNYPTPTQESEVCSYFAEVSNVKAVVGTVNKKKAGIFIYTLNNIVKSRWQIQ